MLKCIRTDRLLLGPCPAEDADDVVSGSNDLAVSHWLVRLAHLLKCSHLLSVCDEGQTRWPQLMAITLAGRAIDAISTGAYYGLWLCRDIWGQRFATGATDVALSIAQQISQGCESSYFVCNTSRARTCCRAGVRKKPTVTRHLKGAGS